MTDTATATADDGEEQNRTTFAFGANVTRGCQCPAVAAGYDPDLGDSLGTVVIKYDERASNKHPSRRDSGTLTEERAKEAWLETIEDLEDALGGYRPAVGEEELELAKEIAEELGWS